MILDKQGITSEFEVVIQSCDIGIRKPNLKIFQKGLKEMGTKPTETMSIGNSPYFDIYPAQKLGMMTVLLRSELSYREPDDFSITITPDYSINKIAELVGLVDLLI